jgi:hypothetical protein
MKMLTRKDASHLLSKRLERPLTARERWGLRFHLWICANCRRFERQMDFMRMALRKLGQRAESEAQGADLTPEARERIRKALAERSGRER